jgi:SPP1 family phage portal protein
MDNKQLKKALAELQSKAVKVQMNEAYFEGKNPYILKKPTEKKPDNRIPIALGKMAVEKMAGYAGRKGDIKTEYRKIGEGEEDADNNDFLNYVRDMNSYNDEELETSELYEEQLIQGKAYEVWYVSDAMQLNNSLLTAEYKIVPTSSVYLKHNNSIKKELEYGILFSGDEQEMTATVYEAGLQTTYISRDGGDFSFLEEVITPFTQVPINVFSGNRRESPLFEAEKCLIDSLDELISKSMNEVDRFNAAIALFGHQVSPGFIDDLAKGLIRVIAELDDTERADLPKYLHKELGGIDSFYNTLTDRVENLFWKSIGIPDFTDESFNGAQTGIALKLKLVGMEFKAAQIETYFSRGLINRLYLYADVYNSTGNKVDVNEYQAIVKANRNLPVDDEAKLRIAAMLMGLGLDLKHIIKFLPNSIIEDMTDKEIEEMLGNVDDEELLNPALDGSTDIEQATELVKLSGIQITAANEIIGAVARGELDREAGIQQLITFLGLTRQQAENVMGKQTGSVNNDI